MHIVDNSHISCSTAFLTGKEWHMTYYAADRTRQDICLAVSCVVGFLAHISRWSYWSALLQCACSLHLQGQVVYKERLLTLKMKT
jgi:hypothetical protein